METTHSKTRFSSTFGVPDSKMEKLKLVQLLPNTDLRNLSLCTQDEEEMKRLMRQESLPIIQKTLKGEVTCKRKTREFVNVVPCLGLYMCRATRVQHSGSFGQGRSHERGWTFPKWRICAPPPHPRTYQS